MGKLIEKEKVINRANNLPNNLFAYFFKIGKVEEMATILSYCIIYGSRKYPLFLFV